MHMHRRQRDVYFTPYTHLARCAHVKLNVKLGTHWTGPFHLVLVAIIPRGQCTQVSVLGRIKSRAQGAPPPPLKAAPLRRIKQWETIAAEAD